MVPNRARLPHHHRGDSIRGLLVRSFSTGTFAAPLRCEPPRAKVSGRKEKGGSCQPSLRQTEPPSCDLAGKVTRTPVAPRSRTVIKDSTPDKSRKGTAVLRPSVAELAQAEAVHR